MDPRITVEVQTLAGYRGRYFLVDTGADFTTAPRSLLEQVGIDWNRLTTIDVMGIGPRSFSAKLGHLPIRLGETELTVRCLFIDRPHVPLVLGCADVLDRFALTIDAGQGKIVFTEIP